MPAKRKLTMRQLRQMLRLARDGASSREIARVLGVARSTVQENLKRAMDAGLSWPLPGELTDDALEQRLFDRAGVKQGTRRRPEPNWAELVIDLKKPGVTMMVLWEEYRAVQPDGYGYSRFCELFRGFERRLSPSMRQDHVAGDKVFVDYSGKKIAIVDPHTGEIREAEIFVAVLGASNFTYAEATWTQSLPDWIGAHVRMFRFFGGVPRLVVPDNLKAGVHKASFYDPELNRSYGMMASHYGVGVLPARPRRPKDKAKVENGVRFAQTCILGRLRRQTFFSLADANAAIAGALDRINDHVVRRLGVTRRHLFETIERRALAPLPGDEYEFAEWRLARVGVDYHVEHDGLLLLGAARPDPGAGRRPRDQPHDRAVPSRPTCRPASAPLRRPSARHRSRSHAQFPPPLRGLDAGPLPPLGGLGRAEHRSPGHGHPGPSPASRAGLPNLPRRPAAVPRPRSRPRRSRLGPGPADRCAHLQEHRFHPGQPSGPPTRHDRARGRHRPRQPAWPQLLPLRRTTMLTHPTLDLLANLGLHGMIKGFQDLEAQPEAKALEHAEWLALLLDREMTLRRQKRFESRARAARLRHQASVEDVDFRAARGLDRGLFLKLAGCDWIRARHGLLLTGPTGVGKSWLACALGHKACREDLSVAYHRAPRLFAALALARGDGRYAKMLRGLARVDLLILDDWGPEKLDDEQRRDLLEIIEDRHERRSTIVTSQLPVDRWYEIIGNPTIADAVLDRLLHNAYRIELTGESLRKRRSPEPRTMPA